MALVKKRKPKTDKDTKAKSAARKLKAPEYKSFRLHKRIKSPKQQILGAPRLLYHSLAYLLSHWKLFGGIMLVYLLLSLFLVRGFGSIANLSELKAVLGDYLHGTGGTIAIAITMAGTLFSTASKPATDAGGAYQLLLLLGFSLVLVWALRHQSDGNSVSLKDAFYKSMHPLVPFLLVLLVVAIQLLPLFVAGQAYSLAFNGGVAVTVVERVLWLLFVGLLALWSLYMTSASMFALYIVTLPDIKPMQALRSARDLVQYRRWTVMRKVVFLPVALLLVGGLLMLPVVLLVTPLAEAIFYVLSIASLALVHTYMYNLYRELMK